MEWPTFSVGLPVVVSFGAAAVVYQVARLLGWGRDMSLRSAFEAQAGQCRCMASGHPRPAGRAPADQ